MKFEDYIVLLAIVIITAVLFKFYYVIKLERKRKGFFPIWAAYKFWMWVFPILTKTRDKEMNSLIRKANICTAIAWGGFIAMPLYYLF